MPEDYFVRYLPVLIHALLAAAIAGGIVLFSAILGNRRRSRAKDQPYECGITPTGNARERFSVKFYLVAMLFILFDVEAIFLYPWAVIQKELGWFGFIAMLVYIDVILTGFWYIWKKGVIDWSRTDEGAGW